MSRPIVNRKNCLGDVAAVYNPENVNNFFPLQIFPEGSIHLSGERELPLRTCWTGLGSVECATSPPGKFVG